MKTDKAFTDEFLSIMNYKINSKDEVITKLVDLTVEEYMIHCTNKSQTCSGKDRSMHLITLKYE